MRLIQRATRNDGLDVFCSVQRLFQWTLPEHFGGVVQWRAHVFGPSFQRGCNTTIPAWLAYPVNQSPRNRFPQLKVEFLSKHHPSGAHVQHPLSRSYKKVIIIWKSSAYLNLLFPPSFHP